MKMKKAEERRGTGEEEEKRGRERENRGREGVVCRWAQGGTDEEAGERERKK